MERYPADTKAGIEDFRRADWRSAVDAPTQHGRYYSLWRSLGDLGSLSIENGDPSAGKVLWLLADACSMMLEPESTNEPFRPRRQMVMGRSTLPDDFDDTDLDLFEQISSEMPDVWVRARLYDLGWVRRRKYQEALQAIDAYRQIPLDADTWMKDGKLCWERCLRLTLTLGAGAKDRCVGIEQQLVDAVDNAERKDIILALDAAELLAGCGLARSRCYGFGKKLEGWGKLLADEGKYDHARQYFVAAINCYSHGENKVEGRNDIWRLTASIAESFDEEGNRHFSRAVAGDLYQRALQTYREIPQLERQALGAEKGMQELRGKISKAGKEALGEMKRISVTSDASDVAALVQDFVRGKTPMEALRAFASIHSGPRVAKLRAQVIKRITDFPLSSLFGNTQFSKDGRVVAKRSPIDSQAPDAQKALLGEMVNCYQMELAYYVQGLILPAREVLTLEHRLREYDFVWLAHQSPVIPAGRELLYGKGLFRGYDSEYAEALHLLVPQIEHVVRTKLKAAEAITTTIDSEGIENEVGLSALVKLPQMAECFGEDLKFELTALFCDPNGPNLRNEVAHGLLDSHASTSIFSVYAWWFAFRLMFTHFSVENGASATQQDA